MPILIDRRGMLRAMFPGQSKRATLEEAIKLLLAEKLESLRGETLESAFLAGEKTLFDV